MIKVTSTGLLLLLLFSVTVVAQEKYIASYAGFAGFQAPLWAAKDFGFMAKYGVTADLVMIPGSARGAQALLGGSIHFGQIDGTALISAINQGADLVFVASAQERNGSARPRPSKTHSRGRGGGHQATGLLTTGGRHAALEASVVKKL